MVRWKKFCLRIVMIVFSLLAVSGNVFSSDDVRIKFAGSVADILDKPLKYYSGKEALRIARTVFLYQRNSGGWPKNYESTQVPNQSALSGF